MENEGKALPIRYKCNLWIMRGRDYTTKSSDLRGPKHFLSAFFFKVPIPYSPTPCIFIRQRFAIGSNNIFKSWKVCPTSSGRASGAILSTDTDGGVSILSLREQLCLLSDAGYANRIESIDWTLDGFLMISRSDGSLKVWDSYSMAKEREASGSGRGTIHP